MFSSRENTSNIDQYLRFTSQTFSAMSSMMSLMQQQNNTIQTMLTNNTNSSYRNNIDQTTRSSRISNRLSRPRVTRRESLFNNSTSYSASRIGSRQNSAPMYSWPNAVSDALSLLSFENSTSSFPISNGATAVQIAEGTRRLRYSSIEDPINETCPITREPFQENDILQIRNCGHIFTEPDARGGLGHTQCVQFARVLL